MRYKARNISKEIFLYCVEYADTGWIDSLFYYRDELCLACVEIKLCDDFDCAPAKIKSFIRGGVQSRIFIKM